MDEVAVHKMINTPNHHFILFLIEEKVVGCFRCMLDFSQKKGYTGGFMLKSPYHGTVDVVKAIIGSYFWMWKTFKNSILVWYCENRTAHAASQYITAVCGIHTVALLFNKDIFFHEIESDVLGITYQNHVLTTMRPKKSPKLIENTIDCFLYADSLYDLGNFKIKNGSLELDMNKVEELRNKVSISFSEDKHEYRYVSFSIRENNAFFNFLHTPHIQNCEKVKYKITSHEEFFVFLEYFRLYMRQNNIRYSEVYVSAYKPQHQKLLSTFGFKARGYIPCWKYQVKSGYFEDHIIFNSYKGELSDLELLPEGLKLLNMTN